jgi:hypothetical protein
MAVLDSSVTSVVTRAIWRHIPDDGILKGGNVRAVNFSNVNLYYPHTEVEIVRGDVTDVRIRNRFKNLLKFYHQRNYLVDKGTFEKATLISYIYPKLLDNLKGKRKRCKI